MCGPLCVSVCMCWGLVLLCVCVCFACSTVIAFAITAGRQIFYFIFAGLPITIYTNTSAQNKHAGMSTHTHTCTHTHRGSLEQTNTLAMWQQKFLCVCITFYLILFYSGKPFENWWQIHNNCLLLYACVCDVISLCVGVFENSLCQSCCCCFCWGVSAIFK